MNSTPDPQTTADRSHRTVLAVTVTSRPDGGHYIDQADFTAHVAQWLKTDLKGHHAIDQVTVDDQAAVPQTDRPRALHLLEAADFLRDAHFRDGLSVQEIGAALRHMADAADPMVGSLARDGFGLDEIAAMPVAPAAVPPTGQTGLRERIAQAIADALKPRYGGPQHNTPGGLPLTATAEEVRLHRAQPLADAVLPVLPETARLHDEVLTLRADQAKMRDLLRSENERANAAIDRETTAEEAEEEQRLALSTALGLGTGAPWDAIRERAAELAAQAAPADRAAADDLPDRLEAALTERFTELGNPFAAMRYHEQGPDGWPASHPVGPRRVAEVLRELLTGEAQQDGAKT